MNTALDQSVRVARMSVSCAMWSSAWPSTNRSRISGAGISPSRGCAPMRDRSAAVSGRQPIGPGGEPCVDPGEQHPQRQRPVTIDDPEPEAVVGRPPEWHGVGAGPVDDAFHLAQPEGQHLLDVRQDLARPPRRFRSGPVVLGQRPWLPGHHAWGELGVAASRSRDPIGVARHGGQCGTRGVRWWY